jgi:hypothetical protein
MPSTGSKYSPTTGRVAINVDGAIGDSSRNAGWSHVVQSLQCHSSAAQHTVAAMIMMVTIAITTEDNQRLGRGVFLVEEKEEEVE